MYIKQSRKLKNKLSKMCNKAIDEIIETLINNENMHKVMHGDPDAMLNTLDADIKIAINVQDSKNQQKSFQIVSNPTLDLK